MRPFFNRLLVGLSVFSLVGAAAAFIAPVFMVCACALPPRQVGTPVPFPPPINNGAVIIRSHRVAVTIDNQIATTKITQEFVNEGSRPAEGSYLFPLPIAAAVSNLTMYVNGQPIQAQLLDATQARAIYTETVRRLRDPALLQYVGRSAIQANVFPIPPGDERKIEITYSQVLTADNGLIDYSYPLKADYLSTLPVQQMSVSLDVTSKDPISSIYSPNPLVAISRTDDRHFRAGFETNAYKPSDDFHLYYGVSSSEVSANLLTYRASADEDGYFMLMLNPPYRVDTSKVIPKDVIIVLDQSGSMQGPKWDQARGAVTYVLNHLNPVDRFNVVVFSTGYRIFAKSLQQSDQASAAAKWVNGLQAEGGTDINGALTQALGMATPERQTVVLFLTDGLPTEGVTDLNTILQNVQARANPNLRFFTFGVGDDVNTFLLDSLSSSYRGTSVYVRPSDNIEDQVSRLYNKITSPVLTNVKLDFGPMLIDELYPAEPLPDLFAGSQLIVTGRFRQQGTTTITLSGEQDGKPMSYTFNAMNFPANAGGQPFIPRLWATRKIGALLNQIRLKGETPELVDAVIRLSVRYGIITPYTSYLIQENDIVAQGGNGGATGGVVPPSPRKDASNSPSAQTGSGAVSAAATSNAQSSAGSVAMLPTYAMTPTVVGTLTAAVAGPADRNNPGNEPLKQVGDRTFVYRGGVWIDTQYTADKMKLTPVVFLSDSYFALLDAHPELKEALAIGDHLIIVVGAEAFEIKPS